MRTGRSITKAMTLGIALVCATSLWAAPASADDDRHDRKGSRKHERHDKREWSKKDYQHGKKHVKHARHDHDRRYVYDCAPRRVVRPVRYVRGCEVYAPQPVYCQPTYFHDPYCGQNFTSLAFYFEHVRRHTHAGFALEFQVGSGAAVNDCRYVNNSWVRVAHVSR